MQIHYATIVSARRRDFLFKTIRAWRPERCKMMSFEIVQCPTDELALGSPASLRPCAVGRANGAARPAPVGGISRLGALRLQMATMDASSLPPSEADRITAFEKFAKYPERRNSTPGLGLSTRSMVIAAIGRHPPSRGSAIASDVSNLSHALRYSPVDLYLHT